MNTTPRSHGEDDDEAAGRPEDDFKDEKDAAGHEVTHIIEMINDQVDAPLPT
jgi:hypothetical protein